tara:strand:- start:4596 stop:7016 length:2421 start_codon:yes stop_codon:yes gene_type:complete
VANSIIIRFQPKGDKQLIKAIQALALAQSRLEKNTKQVQKELRELGARGALATKTLRNVSRDSAGAASAFSVLRSKLLLASFGFSLFAGSVGRFANAAGDAEEIANKFNVVFGDNADAVRTWAEAYGDSVGRATTSIMSFASTLQDTFVPMGFARSEATQLSTQLTKLAIDVASFNNAADADVLNAFQSALVGNHETVRRYGIVITEASLQQEALRSKLVETNRPLTNQEKVQARLNLLLKGSKDAIGDAARTQESYANQVKKLNEQWKEFSEALGAEVLPIVTKLVGAMADLLGLLEGNMNRVLGYTTAIAGLATAFYAVRTATKLASKALKGFKASTIAASGGIAALVFGFGELVASFFDVEDSAEKMNDKIEAVNINVKTLSDELKDKGFHSYAAIIDKTANNYESLSDAIAKVEDLQANLNNEGMKYLLDVVPKIKSSIEGLGESKTTKGLTVLVDNLVNAQNKLSEGVFDKESKKSIADFENTFNSYLSILFKSAEGNDNLKSKVHKLNLELLALNRVTRIMTKGNNKLKLEEAALDEVSIALKERLAAVEAERLLKTMSLIPNLDREIAMLTLKNQYSGEELFIQTELLKLEQEGIILSDIEDEQGNSELERFKDKLKAKKDLLDATKLETAWTNKLNSALLEGINNNARFAEAFGNMLKQIAAQIAAKAGVFALMSIFTKGTFAKGVNFLDFIGEGIFHQGGQVQGYATGGMIPMSTYHSGGGVDNVPIMAQEGEFVMRRSAVESIGVENLNRMNRTGQASGGVNVTFSGNVMSDDFVEDVAIPKIKDAIRRGADIGVS